MVKKTFGYIFVFILLALISIAALKSQYVKDWYIVQFGSQQTRAIKVSDKLDLTRDGTFLLKASQPKILGAADFNSACKNVAEEQTIVLGCYTNQNIFVYDVEDSRLSGVKQVTTAHELLHAVYDRLSGTEKEQLNKQLLEASNAISDQHYVDLIQAYKDSEPSELTNEIHSILGTEIKVLPSSLEKHYSKYFTNRAEIVQFSDSYQEQFRKNEQQIKQYEDQLIKLKSDIDSKQQQLASLQSDLNQKQVQLNRLRATDVAAYNNQVPIFNDLVAQYNALVNNVKSLINQYNTIVAERQELGAVQSNLYKKLDSSNYQTR